MMSYQVRVGLKSNMTSVFLRREAKETQERHTRRIPCKGGGRECTGESISKGRQKNCLPEARNRQGKIFLKSFERELGLADTLILDF